MSHHAACQCGSLVVEAEGKPESVVACSCFSCQRRTGSVLGVGAYYPRERLHISGQARTYVRDADSGHRFHTFFCPTCGTSLYWWSARAPDRVGVAVGAFGDRLFPKPERSVFEASKHDWLNLDADVPGFERGRDSTRSR